MRGGAENERELRTVGINSPRTFPRSGFLLSRAFPMLFFASRIEFRKSNLTPTVFALPSRNS